MFGSMLQKEAANTITRWLRSIGSRAMTKGERALQKRLQDSGMMRSTEQFAKGIEKGNKALIAKHNIGVNEDPLVVLSKLRKSVPKKDYLSQKENMSIWSEKGQIPGMLTGEAVALPEARTIGIDPSIAPRTLKWYRNYDQTRAGDAVHIRELLDGLYGKGVDLKSVEPPDFQGLTDILNRIDPGKNRSVESVFSTYFDMANNKLDDIIKMKNILRADTPAKIKMIKELKSGEMLGDSVLKRHEIYEQIAADRLRGRGAIGPTSKRMLWATKKNSPIPGDASETTHAFNTHVSPWVIGMEGKVVGSSPRTEPIQELIDDRVTLFGEYSPSDTSTQAGFIKAVTGKDPYEGLSKSMLRKLRNMNPVNGEYVHNI